jgi:hypothetical protein
MNALAGLQNFNHAGNAMNALAQGMEFGTQLRMQKEQRERQEATKAAYAGAYNGDMSAVNALAPIDPRAAFELRGSMEAAQSQQQEQQRAQLAKVADLLDDSTDEISYQRNLNVARQLGLPVESAPPQFDPEFIRTQSAIARAVLNNDPELPLIAQEVVAAGLQPGTPEFQAEIGRILKSKYSTVKTVPYTQGGGVAAYDIAGGGITPVIVPNPGGQQAGAPVGGVSEGQTATNPATGEKIVFQNGQWQPVGGGVGNGAGNFPGE